jgi:hypothetical protein
MQSARDAFDPFMADLNDVVTYLRNDLTPAGIGSISDLVSRTNNEARTVRGRLSEVIRDLGRVRELMTARP